MLTLTYAFELKWGPKRQYMLKELNTKKNHCLLPLYKYTLRDIHAYTAKILIFGMCSMIRAFFGVTRKQSCKSVLECDQKECLHAIILFWDQCSEAGALKCWLGHVTCSHIHTHIHMTLLPMKEGRQRPGLYHCCCFVTGWSHPNNSKRTLFIFPGWSRTIARGSLVNNLLPRKVAVTVIWEQTSLA